jgi:general secretion pathway protein B
MPASRGSVVYESMPDETAYGTQGAAQQPTQARPAPTGSAANSGTRLPSADELVAAGIPTLNVDLHVYSTTPSERMVFVNSRKYREGDTLQEGPLVRQITPSGAVLEYNGRDYLLTSH